MAKLGVGVLGVGTMGRQHAFNLRHLIPEARLIAVADTNLGKDLSLAEHGNTAMGDVKITP
jgi:predicted dehydrogenase